eukprot:3461175-Amphidinium_carterae.1
MKRRTGTCRKATCKPNSQETQRLHWGLFFRTQQELLNFVSYLLLQYGIIPPKPVRDTESQLLNSLTVRKLRSTCLQSPTKREVPRALFCCSAHPAAQQIQD